MPPRQDAEVAEKSAALKPADDKKVPPMRALPTLFAVLVFGAHFVYLQYERERVRNLPGNPYIGEGSPLWVPMAGSVVYLLLIFVGPRLMEKRAGFDNAIHEFMVVYNFYQSVLNAWIVWGLWENVLARGWPFWGQPYYPEQVNDPSWNDASFFVYVHFQDKYIEYFDSLFMVLRKKNEQLSFLHTWHHFIMGWAWFLVLRVAPAGEAWFGSMCNSFVHVVMYGYYGLRARGIPIPYKRAVTDLQMVQFFLVSTQSFYDAYLTYVVQKPTYPFWLAMVQLGVMINMIVMFSGFYKKKYTKPRTDADAEPAKTK